MDRLRVLGFSVFEPTVNMALDEAIAEAVGSAKSPPTLRFYGWSPSAVSIGYFQEIHEEVDLEFCHSNGIEVVRRITGGGAVIHTKGELTYSFTVCDKDPAVPQDIQGSYMRICAPIVSALRGLGADAVFAPINDIEVGGKKISGNAQTRRFGAVLQHGTILIDLERGMLRALKVKREKLQDRGADSVGNRLITLKEILGRDLRPGEVSGAIAKEFKKHFKCKVEYGKASPIELCRVPAIAERHKSIDWLFRR
uniref:Lipoate--protein ligase family protein n=1 Tax=Candidatus Methanomethylicus mesodigestus TaxID=1867258 RepID=A0A7C3J548_9CREN